MNLLLEKMKKHGARQWKRTQAHVFGFGVTTSLFLRFVLVSTMTITHNGAASPIKQRNCVNFIHVFSQYARKNCCFNPRNAEHWHTVCIHLSFFEIIIVSCQKWISFKYCLDLPSIFGIGVANSIPFVCQNIQAIQFDSVYRLRLNFASFLSPSLFLLLSSTDNDRNHCTLLQ